MKPILRVSLGVLLIVASIPFWRLFLLFPIGLYTTIKLLISDQGIGNVGHLLGLLTGDFLAFALGLVLLYFGVRLLLRRSPAAVKEPTQV